MKRRTLLASLVVASSAGCLRLQSTDGGTTTEAEATADEQAVSSGSQTATEVAGTDEQTTDEPTTTEQTTTEAPTAAESDRLDLRWRSGIRSYEAVVEGPTMYAFPGSNGVHAVEIETGATQWSAAPDATLRGAAVDGDAVFAADRKGDGSLYAVDTDDQSTRWTADLGGSARPPVRASEEFAVAGSWSEGEGSRLTAFDRETGEERWTWEHENSVGEASPVVDGTIYVGTTGAPTIHAIDVQTGREQWVLEQGSEFPVIVADGSLYCAWTSRVAKISLEDRSKKWQVRLDGTIPRQPVLTDGRLFTGVDGGAVVALDVVSGEEVWRADVPFNRDSALAVGPDAVWVATQSELHAVDRGSAEAELVGALNTSATHPQTTEAVFHDGTLVLCRGQSPMEAYDVVE
ncbi:outer membrane protein assembly factor BamB family protein [Halorussus litoreus]|uniref:outer membrane protein assembly factor BamB family protein n=1 Tax=Halorussus litoreus TaxID=1710536 RepID=UPI0013003696|nr:PQQ-binding-like beta-propeller repeat protein [Halorussus litoreus]